MPTDDCPKCGDNTDATGPCADCRRKIHEGWHLQGMYWIRPEECHEQCPGYLKDKAAADAQEAR